MSNYTQIRAELDSNPGLYGSMTDQEVVDELNNKNKTKPKPSISASSFLSAIEPAAFAALNTSNVGKMQLLVATGSLDINDLNIKADIEGIFPPATVSHTAIFAMKDDIVSQAEKVGLGKVNIGDVKNARAL